MSILQKYLKKLNVESYTDLNEEEKKTYSEWETVLNGRKLTDDEVANFIDMELIATLDKLVKETTNTREDTFLKMKLEMLRKLKSFLNIPEMEKKMVEQGISNLIN